LVDVCNTILSNRYSQKLLSLLYSGNYISGLYSGIIRSLLLDFLEFCMNEQKDVKFPIKYSVQRMKVNSHKKQILPKGRNGSLKIKTLV
jgi:hypothetical protein